MRRPSIAGLALLCGLVTLAPRIGHAADATPVRQHHHRVANRINNTAPVHARTMPLLQAFQPAPMPNLDIAAPMERANADVKLRPAIFEAPHHFLGDGYVYGSSPQGMDDAKAQRVAGVKMSVPLQ